MDDPMTFWEAMFAESESQGWPQAAIAIPLVAYKADRRAIAKTAKKHGFERARFTGDKTLVHYIRFV